MHHPPIMVIAPPPIQATEGPIAAKFVNAETKAAGLHAAFQNVANELQCDFFDAGAVTTSSVIDGVHLDQDQHLTLGTSLASRVAEILIRENN